MRGLVSATLVFVAFGAWLILTYPPIGIVFALWFTTLLAAGLMWAVLCWGTAPIYNWYMKCKVKFDRYRYFRNFDIDYNHVAMLQYSDYDAWLTEKLYPLPSTDDNFFKKVEDFRRDFDADRK